MVYEHWVNKVAMNLLSFAPARYCPETATSIYKFDEFHALFLQESALFEWELTFRLGINILLIADIFPSTLLNVNCITQITAAIYVSLGTEIDKGHEQGS